MPRPSAPNSCRTCRKRKIKCDQTLPVCNRCQKQNLFCDRSSTLTVKQYRHSSTDQTAVQISPQRLLQDPDIARLFHIYIKELASWYDLNDATLSFGQAVPSAALENPLLFAAIIALGGTYASRKYSFPIEVSETYHTRCLKLLISLSAGDTAASNGIALAATCLLRSYEILTEEEDPNRHLFGASTLLPPVPKLSERGLLVAGFWNYLREDITYSLIHGCPLKVDFGVCRDQPETDEEHANYMTLLLAKIVNSYYGTGLHLSELNSSVKQWRQKVTISPFSISENGLSVFPVIRMLRDCHVATLQYYHVALCMTEVETQALSSAVKICGLAMHAESDAVMVNAYGPICFSARWLKDGTQRQELVLWLRNSQKATAWPVNVLTAKIQADWDGINYE